MYQHLINGKHFKMPKSILEHRIESEKNFNAFYHYVVQSKFNGVHNVVCYSCIGGIKIIIRTQGVFKSTFNSLKVFEGLGVQCLHNDTF